MGRCVQLWLDPGATGGPLLPSGTRAGWPCCWLSVKRLFSLQPKLSLRALVFPVAPLRC